MLGWPHFFVPEHSTLIAKVTAGWQQHSNFQFEKVTLDSI